MNSKVTKLRVTTNSRQPTLKEIDLTIGQLQVGDEVNIKFIGSCGTADCLDYGVDITVKNNIRRIL